MGKLLFWAAVVLVGLLVLRLMARHSAASNRAGKRAAKGQPRRLERMVQCAHCGVHLPEQDAIRCDGHTWCSDEHARRGLRH